MASSSSVFFSALLDFCFLDWLDREAAEEDSDDDEEVEDSEEDEADEDSEDEDEEESWRTLAVLIFLLSVSDAFWIGGSQNVADIDYLQEINSASSRWQSWLETP